MAVAEEQGVDIEVVKYLKEPPDRETLEHIVRTLEDPVEDLVRKDSVFKKLELDPDDYVGDAEAVVDVLVAHPKLLQRPVLSAGSVSIIGRPGDRIGPFLDANG